MKGGEGRVDVLLPMCSLSCVLGSCPTSNLSHTSYPPGHSRGPSKRAPDLPTCAPPCAVPARNRAPPPAPPSLRQSVAYDEGGSRCARHRRLRRRRCRRRRTRRVRGTNRAMRSLQPYLSLVKKTFEACNDNKQQRTSTIDSRADSALHASAKETIDAPRSRARGAAAARGRASASGGRRQRANSAFQRALPGASSKPCRHHL
jgi:hypothetical protein